MSLAAHFTEDLEHYTTSFALAKLLRIGTPFQCTWADVFGLEFTLAATVLKLPIVVLGNQIEEAVPFKQLGNARKHESFAIFNPKTRRAKYLLLVADEPLFIKSVSVPFNTELRHSYELPVLPVLHHQDCHFMALKPPKHWSPTKIARRVNCIDLSGYEYARYSIGEGIILLCISISCNIWQCKVKFNKLKLISFY